LLAHPAPSALSAGPAPAVLAARDMSDLMTDFFCDLAGHAASLEWANRVHHQAGSQSDPLTPAQTANATRVRARLLRRGEGDSVLAGADAGHAAGGRTPVEPLDPMGQGLRGQDVAAFGLPGGRGPGVRGAVLRNTQWTGKRLTGLDLTRADLSGADLRRTHLDRVSLAGARLDGARLTEARLAGVNLTGADLTAADLTRARLSAVDLTGALLTR